MSLGSYQLGDFSTEYQNNSTTFQLIEFNRPYYLMETNEIDWTTEETKPDDKYPTPNNEPKGYKLKLVYSTDKSRQNNGDDITKEFYLPTIKRNYLHKIFVRITENLEVEVNTRSVPWVEKGVGHTNIDITPGHSNATDNKEEGGNE